jgi:hypothetical protein
MKDKSDTNPVNYCSHAIEDLRATSKQLEVREALTRRSRVAKLRADFEVHREAMKTAIEAVGHSRPKKTGMYMSTFAQSWYCRMD